MLTDECLNSDTMTEEEKKNWREREILSLHYFCTEDQLSHRKIFTDSFSFGIKKKEQERGEEELEEGKPGKQEGEEE